MTDCVASREKPIRRKARAMTHIEEEVTTETRVPHDEAAMIQDAILKQTSKLANSTSDVVLKYILLIVLAMFGAMFWVQWRVNTGTPDRLIELIQKSVDQNTASLKVQEASLRAQEDSLRGIREFSVRVPIEHANHDARIGSLAASFEASKRDSEELRRAVLANTEAVTRLVKVLEIKTGNQP